MFPTASPAPLDTLSTASLTPPWRSAHRRGGGNGPVKPSAQQYRCHHTACMMLLAASQRTASSLAGLSEILKVPAVLSIISTRVCAGFDSSKHIPNGTMGACLERTTANLVGAKKSLWCSDSRTPSHRRWRRQPTGLLQIISPRNTEYI